MLRSMYAAISGMQAFETKLDVIGNNIANVDTTGFKASRVDFSDVLSQTLSGGNAPVYNPVGGQNFGSGGTNPAQIGLGVRVASIPILFTQGADQSTGNPTDAAINGAGFFTVTDGTSLYLTRAGDFSVDANHNLVLPNGDIAMGFQFTQTNPPNQPTIALDMSNNPSQNESKLVQMNLDQLLQQFVTVALPNISDTSGGKYGSYQNGSIQYTPSGGNTVNRTFALPNSPDVEIGSDGSVTVTVTYTDTDNNGKQVDSGTMRLTIGKLAIASVNNPQGLERVGDTLFQVTPSSGQATYTVAGMNNTGTIASGYLEMSNVDLTREFTEMIIAQRGFDANSHVIGTDNAILNDIVNLKNS